METFSALLVRYRFSLVQLVGGVASLLSAASPAEAATFNFRFDAPVPQPVVEGVEAAGAVWSSWLADDVVVNLDVQFGPLSRPVPSLTVSGSALYSYEQVRTALFAKATTTADLTAIAHLQGGPSVDLLINRTINNPHGMGSSTAYLDSDGDANNQSIRLTHANAKALGLRNPQGGDRDGTLQLSSLFPWDFDASDGINSGTLDFVGIVSHAIGSTLGFMSGVDVLDFNSPLAVGTQNYYFPDSAFTYVTALDLFRFSEESVQHGVGVIDWTASSSSKYFSIDGGETAIAEFSTGVRYGDGRQASHWKERSPSGLMQPSVLPGQALRVDRATDVMALDVIGWTPKQPPARVPEPTAWAGLLAIAVWSLGARSWLRGRSDRSL
ncbi:NF038122 family metalloprotease [Geitlerinema sp. PCC 7407]|uniref:NF038122 family metalloprotease n=1 Tax=Geitlerinema sp. PCC 7407 TaxID=1173025 RepID=UPI00029FE016|nr:NF038122 family metalloprotease [Geitlerinema sp. PCC 7407]AFY65603.1 hypothetical protein GEI7407_1106 [Geitlerinema sp. PCC 7407]